MPIFQTFANQTCSMSINWCEFETIHHSMEEMDNSLQKGVPRNMDELAYDHYRNERVAFEGSSGKYKANINKIVDDSTKQVSTMIAMLKDIVNRHLDANFKTFLDTKVFGIQSVRSSIVLSEVQVKEDGRFSYREVHSAEVPTVYEENCKQKWLKPKKLSNGKTSHGILDYKSCNILCLHKSP